MGKEKIKEIYLLIRREERGGVGLMLSRAGEDMVLILWRAGEDGSCGEPGYGEVQGQGPLQGVTTLLGRVNK